MRWPDKLRLRLRSLFKRQRVEQELDKELRFHIEQQIEENRAAGMTAEEARLAAVRAVGGIAQIQEQCRDKRGLRFIDDLAQDLRYAVRTLRKSRVFTIVAVATLAVGIGASSAVFTQVNAVFWNTLAVKEPRGLWTFSWTAKNTNRPNSSLPYAAYLAMHDNAKRFTSLACSWGVRFPPLAEWGPLRLQLVTGNYFQTAGVDTVLGRPITPDDDLAGNPAFVAVISHSLWQRVYGGSPDALNRTISIRGTPFQIIGVMQPGFAGLDPMSPREVILPSASHPALGPLAPTVSTSCGQVIGRTASDVSDEEARAEAEILFRQAILANPLKDVQEPRLLLTNMTEDRNVLRLRQSASFPLLLLMSAVSVILLIVCANIAGLLLARGRGRQKEIATRLAVGAARSRIIRQLLTESVLLSLAGGAFGIAGVYSINPRLPALLTQLSGNFTLGGRNPTLAVDLSPDLRVIGFSIAITIFCGLFFGLLPAVRMSSLDLISAMKQASAMQAAARFRFRGGKALVVVQVALSTLLLIGAGLFIRTFVNLRAAPLGYIPDGVLFVTIDPYGVPRQFVEDSVAQLQELPGVIAASASVWPIFSNGGPVDKRPFCVDRNPGDQSVDTEYVFPRFFETWGVSFVQGQDFEKTAEPVVIVNETFAKNFLKGRNVIGQTIGAGRCPGMPRTIAGVVADHIDRQRAAVTPMVYMPYPSRGMEPTTLALRAVGNPGAMIPTVRRIVEGLNTRIDGDVTTGVEYKERTFKQERLLAGLLVFFGLAAVLISSLGIYGMLAYIVSRRTSEIGIRIALGAEGPDVIRMVILETLAPVTCGIALGVIAAFGLTRWIESILFGVSKHDPWTIAGSAIVFLLTAAIAAFLPARRASRIDPMRALRYE